LPISSLFTILAVVIGGILAVRFLGRRGREDARKEKERQEKASDRERPDADRHETQRATEADEREPPPFVRNVQVNSIDPMYQKYCRSLAELGLKSGASVSEIKSAYRKLMKESHPDRLQGDQAFASERFMKIRAAYEEALFLEKENNYSKRGAPKTGKGGGGASPERP
jgi:hypothetical protein